MGNQNVKRRQKSVSPESSPRDSIVNGSMKKSHSAKAEVLTDVKSNCQFSTLDRRLFLNKFYFFLLKRSYAVKN